MILCVLSTHFSCPKPSLPLPTSAVFSNCFMSSHTLIFHHSCRRRGSTLNIFHKSTRRYQNTFNFHRGATTDSWWTGSFQTQSKADVTHFRESLKCCCVVCIRMIEIHKTHTCYKCLSFGEHIEDSLAGCSSLFPLTLTHLNQKFHLFWAGSF